MNEKTIIIIFMYIALVYLVLFFFVSLKMKRMSWDSKYVKIAIFSANVLYNKN